MFFFFEPRRHVAEAAEDFRIPVGKHRQGQTKDALKDAAVNFFQRTHGEGLLWDVLLLLYNSGFSDATRFFFF